MPRITVGILPLALLVLTSNGSAAERVNASMASLPSNIKTALLGLCAPCTFADHDAPWNHSDVLDGKPQRHLKSIVVEPDSWLIEYDHGGIATHNHTVEFVLTPSLHLGSKSDCLPSKQVKCEW